MKLMFWSFWRIFAVSFALIVIALYCNARWFTPMPDNDSDLAAWGIRYALIPIAAGIYAVATSMLTLLIREVISKIAFLEKHLKKVIRLPPAWFKNCLEH
jgi:hypothetical protein